MLWPIIMMKKVARERIATLTENIVFSYSMSGLVNMVRYSEGFGVG